MIAKFFSCLLICVFTSCESISQIITPNIANYNIVTKENVNSDWYHKDIIQDSVPGTSLFRTHEELLKDKEGKEVIVAILDMSVDIHHTYLKENIWTNLDEIADNNIDDDGNGYIDDIHGWNFLGNQNGENLSYEQFDFVRIIKRYAQSTQPLNKKDSLLLKRAKAAYTFNLKNVNDDLENAKMVIESRTNAETYLKKIFGEQEYTVKDLDSLKKAFPNDTLLQSQALRMSNFITYNFTPERNASRKESLLNFKKFMLNQDYPERAIIGDSVQENLYSIYGNNQVDANVSFLNHGTLTSGFLVTKYLNKDSINIFKNIKIMPLRISAYGNEHDKDIALAIRYAVDQGARVINMSFGKQFSMDKQWVDDAVRYAESKGVLMVKSAGNDRFNTDLLENVKYPNDYNNGKEISDNFITVGGTSYQLDEKFLYYKTNYGKENVDIFAPGYHLTTLLPNNKIGYKYSGTSFSSAIVSGISALLFSYYPELDAKDVKRIILDSGLEFDLLVNLPKERGEETVQKSFNQLSKSGKLINAYNAFLLAETYTKH